MRESNDIVTYCMVVTYLWGLRGSGEKLTFMQESYSALQLDVIIGPGYIEVVVRHVQILARPVSSSGRECEVSKAI